MRDTGNSDAVINEVHTAELAGKDYVNGLTVSDFPASSLGKAFIFKVVVYTEVSDTGVMSSASVPMLLAGIPDTPLSGPTRDALSNDV